MTALPDFSDPYWFVITTIIFFIVVIGRYLLIAGIFYAVFYSWFPTKWRQRKLSSKRYKPHQFRKEIIWSTITAILFSIIGTITLLLWQQGDTQVYTRVSLFGWWYLPLSLLAVMLLQETYYYWLHRWMHLPKVFRVVHKVHHDSNITSPWTAFSFHPIEGFLQAILLPLILLIVPLHPAVIIILLILMSFSSVINHLDIELYPKKFHKHLIGRWIIGATHHSLHHKQFKYNYGLYFTFWDKLKNTESPTFEKLFEKATSGKEQEG